MGGVSSGRKGLQPPTHLFEGTVHGTPTHCLPCSRLVYVGAWFRQRCCGVLRCLSASSGIGWPANHSACFRLSRAPSFRPRRQQQDNKNGGRLQGVDRITPATKVSAPSIYIGKPSCFFVFVCSSLLDGTLRLTCCLVKVSSSLSGGRIVDTLLYCRLFVVIVLDFAVHVLISLLRNPSQPWSRTDLPLREARPSGSSLLSLGVETRCRCFSDDQLRTHSSS